MQLFNVLQLVCNALYSWFLQCFIMVVEWKLQIKAVSHARVVQNYLLQNCGIDAHTRLSRLLTRPWTCSEAQYVCHLVSSLNENRRVLPGLIMLLLIWRYTINWVLLACIIQSIKSWQVLWKRRWICVTSVQKYWWDRNCVHYQSLLGHGCFSPTEKSL